MKHPTHAVRYANNWDGEGDIETVLAIKQDGIFYSYDTNKILLEYEGDEILKVWELNGHTDVKRWKAHAEKLAHEKSVLNREIEKLNIYKERVKVLESEIELLKRQVSWDKTR